MKWYKKAISQNSMTPGANMVLIKGWPVWAVAYGFPYKAIKHIRVDKDERSLSNERLQIEQLHMDMEDERFILESSIL